VKAVAGLFAVAVWATAIMLGLTGMTHYQPQAATVEITDRGTARVVDCVEEGPIGGLGVGYWWTCQADVVWDGGERERVRAQPGQFSPDDRDLDVPVVQRTVLGNKGGGPGTPQVYRADFEPSAVLGLGSMLAGIGLGGLLALIIFGAALSRTKARRTGK
jgi:hypothetical protein